MTTVAIEDIDIHIYDTDALSSGLRWQTDSGHRQKSERERQARSRCAEEEDAHDESSADDTPSR
jgi:hypothetical protein